MLNNLSRLQGGPHDQVLARCRNSDLDHLPRPPPPPFRPRDFGRVAHLLLPYRLCPDCFFRPLVPFPHLFRRLRLDCPTVGLASTRFRRQRLRVGRQARQARRPGSRRRARNDGGLGGRSDHASLGLARCVDFAVCRRRRRPRRRIRRLDCGRRGRHRHDVLPQGAEQPPEGDHEPVLGRGGERREARPEWRSRRSGQGV